MDAADNSGSNRKIITAVIILVAIVLVVVGAKLLASKKDAPSPAATSSSPATTNTNSSTTFKDGTFTATGNYSSPGGNEAIKVSITLKDDAVTDSSVTPSITTDDQAQEYQNDFIGAYKKLVVGKKLDTIHLSRVSGSSLTSQGFNDALNQIANQAKG
jgi:uncharacterized protein with FMN-binding domain